MLLPREDSLERLETYLSMTTAGVWEAIVEGAAQYLPGALGVLCGSFKDGFLRIQCPYCFLSLSRGPRRYVSWRCSKVAGSAINHRGVVKRARDVICK